MQVLLHFQVKSEQILLTTGKVPKTNQRSNPTNVHIVKTISLLLLIAGFWGDRLLTGTQIRQRLVY